MHRACYGRHTGQATRDVHAQARTHVHGRLLVRGRKNKRHPQEDPRCGMLIKECGECGTSTLPAQRPRGCTLGWRTNVQFQSGYSHDGPYLSETTYAGSSVSTNATLTNAMEDAMKSTSSGIPFTINSKKQLPKSCWPPVPGTSTHAFRIIEKRGRRREGGREGGGRRRRCRV